MLSVFAVLALSLASTGSVPTSALGPFTTVTVDSANAVGRDTSLVMNSSGFPVIAHYDFTNVDLKVTVCDDATCTTSTSTTVDSAGNVGQYTSLALNSAGFPVISYYDQTNTALKVAVCNDATCTTSTRTTVDSTGDVGQYSSLALNGAGFPVIAYYDGYPNYEVEVAVCSDATCTASTTRTTVDSNGVIGAYTSMELNSNDFPVISYYDSTNVDLKLAVCGNTTCTASTTFTAVDGNGPAGTWGSLELNGAGFPVISYSGADVLNVAICDDATCTAPTVTTVDGSASGSYNSLALSASGFPVISYLGPDFDLKVAVCGDTTCGTTSQPFRTLTTVDSVGLYNSVALNSSGFPVISYYDAGGNENLKIAYVPATDATVDVYAGATAASAPTPDAPDGAGESPTAEAAKLGWPTNMAFDAGGNLYFTDRYNHTVRMVAADGGAVTTIAGQPGVRCPVTTDPCGDKGPATSAHLRSPWGIAVDGATPPNIYVSDYGNHRVRKIDATTGIIHTIAGTGVAGYDGEGFGVDEQLNHPSGLTLDADGAVLVADRGNHRIRKIDQGSIISTFLGTGSPGSSVTSCSTLGTAVCTLDQPTDIKVRGSSTIPSVASTTDFFIADRANDTILATRDGGSGDGIIADRIGSGVAGYTDGDTTTARFDQPVSLAYDSLHQELYIADSHNLRVRRYSAVNQEITTIAGNGTGKLGDSAYIAPDNGAAALSTSLNFPIGVAFLPTGTESQGRAHVTAVYENQIRDLTIAPTSPPPP